MKKSLLKLSVAIPLALAPTLGNAQSNANSDLLDRIFTLGQPKASGQDREQVNQALDSAILNPGQPVDWSSSASGNSGTVAVTRSYTNSLDYDCRDYRRTTITGQTETVHEGTVCKQLFIGWTLESEKEVSSQTLAQQPAVSAPPAQQPAAAPQTTQPATPSVPRPVVIVPAPQQPAPTAPQTTQPVTPSVSQPVVSAPPPQQAAVSAPAPQPNPEVLVTQKLLAQLGYDPGPADGLYGGKTRIAIEQYQRSQNLAVDGQVSSTLLLDLVAATKRKADAPQTDSVTASVAVPPPPPLARPLAPPPAPLAPPQIGRAHV